MARHRQYSDQRRAGRYSRYTSDYERARQHIEDARRLSQELGGMDRDVKNYFFSLPEPELRELLQEYGQKHGTLAREYAEETMPRWRSGGVKMSGTVAERLFNLLPPRMPLTVKHDLVEGLWKHVGPSSKRTMRVGLDVSVDEVVSLSHEHVDEVINAYRIPEKLEKRFHWLSAGDVGVKQDLLNHFREMEKAMVVNAACAQLPVMLEHLQNDEAKRTHRMAQVLEVGKHELELLLDRDATGAQLETPAETGQRNWHVADATESGMPGWWWIVGAAAAVVAWLVLT